MQSGQEILLRSRVFTVERGQYTDRQGQQHVRDVVRHPGSVVIVPCVDRDHVCLIHSYRYAVNRRLLELPAGTREIGEDPMVTAARELEEETGFRCQRLTALQRFLPAPGILDEEMHLFMAEGLTPGPPRREPGEDIENRIVSWEDALAMVSRGEIEDGKTLIGLLLGSQRRSR
jgi:ADP-ribose pyrophosphatase